ncbi:MAG: ABC transporter ATP-binding protein [Lachnospiraceae bacterium]|nr:ABC transporter ATP-binding protein [Lachnospiraceae bacterium]
MIKGEHISKSFDGFQALRDVNIHVPKGSVYGLVGPNGAGKSTLLRHITGIFRQDEGSILVSDEPVYENTAIKSQIAYIPDEVFYFRQSTIVDMMKYYSGIYPGFDRELFYKLLEIFPELDVKRHIRQMSKGMQKQAAFILAISICPQLLVLDEPVDGLDPVMRRQIWSILLAEVEKSQMTVLVSSHNLRELEDVCDYVGIMHKGTVVLEHSLTELQGGVVKLQIAFAGECPDVSDTLPVLHQTSMGKVHTMIVKGSAKEVESKVKAYDPILVDILPLTLEEIFIYELGGMDYEVKDIIM